MLGIVEIRGIFLFDLLCSYFVFQGGINDNFKLNFKIKKNV